MNLANEYRQQFEWRAWSTIFDALPPVREQVVLDLGCAVGDQAAELVARGARVVGVDVDQGLIEEARSRGLPNADFRRCDLRALPDLEVMGDGLWCSFVDTYAHDALAANRYDFHMGNKLSDHLERSGFHVSRVLKPVDQELAFDGPARPEVAEAWRKRFDRMTGLRNFCGDEFERVRDEFLCCISHSDHRSLSKVYCCIARK